MEYCKEFRVGKHLNLSFSDKLSDEEHCLRLYGNVGDEIEVRFEVRLFLALFCRHTKPFSRRTPSQVQGEEEEELPRNLIFLLASFFPSHLSLSP